jgi:hypothetical protein
MSIVLWTRVEALEERVAALEAVQAAARVAAAEQTACAPALARSNAMRKAEGARLRGDIRRIVAAHAGPEKLTACAVLDVLSKDAPGRLPALRTVQWHLCAIRNDDGVAGAHGTST